MAIDAAWVGERAEELQASVLFLTRLRYGPTKPVDGRTIGQAAWAFPIAGLLVGLIGAAVYWLAQRTDLPAWPAAALAVAATMAVTGCLHEDGLADAADGLGGGATRDRKLEIMRDSRTGAYGVCALVLSILLRAAALASLASAGTVALALLAAHAAARAVLPAFMYFVPPARSNGLSAAAGQPARDSAAAAAILAVIVLFVCLGALAGFVALILLAIVAVLVAWLSLSQIGGQTGDILGAVEQISEIVILLVALH